MNRTFYILALLSFSFLSMHAQKESEVLFFEQLKSDAIILSEDGLIKGKNKIKDFVDDLLTPETDNYSYQQNFNIAVNNNLSYEVGLLTIASKSFAVYVSKG